MKTMLRTTAILALLSPGACQTQRYYADEGDVELVDLTFGSTDLQLIAADMANSLVAAPGLGDIERTNGTSGRIRVFMGDVENATSEHIDTVAITDSIRTAMLQSGRFSLTASDMGRDQVMDEIRYQQGSGAVDPASARRLGQQIGADVIVYGRLISIVKSQSRGEDRYYKFTLEMVNLDTADVLWIDEKEIRKRESRGLFN